MTQVAKRDFHFGVRPQCGLCSALLSVSERFFLLIGNSTSTSFSEWLGPFYFPAHGHFVRSKNGIHLCRKQQCSMCVTAMEASTVHSDCFNVIAGRCKLQDVFDNLWVTTAWRSPWRFAPYLQLDELAILPDFSVIDKLGMSQIKLMPPEILHVIHTYSQSSSFWRYSVVTHLAQSLHTSPDQLQSIPLRNISAWSRGGRLETIQNTCQPIIRLIIDSQGIKRIESLTDYPEFKTWRTDYFVYIVLERFRVAETIAHLKAGKLRLELPKACRGFHIWDTPIHTWDTPTPPRLSKCTFCFANIGRSTRFKTINLSRISGLTFFISDEDIYGIHAHSPVSPYASSTYLQFTKRRRSAVTWVYIPISQRDYIATLGIGIPQPENIAMASICLLFRMRLGGDIIIGLTSSKGPRSFLTCGTSPHILVYDTDELKPISSLGTFPAPRKPAVPTLPLSTYAMGAPPFTEAYFSIAPLEHVQKLKIFNDAETGYCMGILLKYKNGAQRSLGQCRIGVDQVDYYDNPVRLCLQRCQVPSKAMRNITSLQVTNVKILCTTEHHHIEDGWTCHTLQGQLHFWYSCNETHLTIVVD